MDCIHHCDSPLGKITLAADGEALTGLWFDGQKHFGSTLKDGFHDENLPVFNEAKRWLDIYFSGCAPDFTPALCLRGTPFRKAVWEILLSVPFSRTVTYGQIARRLSVQAGLPGMSARAVGNAVGHNPVALIVPCHRVLGSDGSLTGYAGGMDRKARLLQMEHTVRV